MDVSQNQSDQESRTKDNVPMSLSVKKKIYVYVYKQVYSQKIGKSAQSIQIYNDSTDEFSLNTFLHF